MHDMTTLHFSLGPVQTFVGQSRRTRDLWASSFLLSYLVGRALDALVDTPEQMILPDIRNNTLFQAIRAHRLGQQLAARPRHGTLPNRFVIRVKDPQAAVAQATQAIDEAWSALADAVWESYVEPVAEHGTQTRAIWQRQVQGFWQLSWALGEDPSLLDRRKNWRPGEATEEPGDKCMMMHRFQELSGYIRSHSADARRRQQGFWASLRAQRGMGLLDLGEDERLCAIGLIKRLYPKVAAPVIGWQLGVTHWPSTAFLAAAPWVARAAELKPRACADYARQITSLHQGARGEWHTDLKMLSNLSGDFSKLDGNFFFDTTLENSNATPLGEGDESARLSLLDTLRSTLYRAEGVGRPSNFYALLLMDGDKMGAVLREAEEAGQTRQTSDALGRFAGQVDACVHAYHGMTVYAGGDDVLAILTLPQAHACALALRERYTQAFDQVKPHLNTRPTISAALVYAHFKTPLRLVLAQAHHLLDDVAKDEFGRASIAFSVMTSSAAQLQWALPWEHLESSHEHLSLLDELLQRMSEDDADESANPDLIKAVESAQFSSSFIYAMRDLFGLLDTGEYWQPGRYAQLPDGLDAEALMLADYMRARGANISLQDAQKRVRAILKCAQRVSRDPAQDIVRADPDQIGFDALLLARFLREQGFKMLKKTDL